MRYCLLATAPLPLLPAPPPVDRADEGDDDAEDAEAIRVSRQIFLNSDVSHSARRELETATTSETLEKNLAVLPACPPPPQPPNRASACRSAEEDDAVLDEEEDAQDQPWPPRHPCCEHVPLAAAAPPLEMTGIIHEGIFKFSSWVRAAESSGVAAQEEGNIDDPSADRGHRNALADEAVAEEEEEVGRAEVLPLPLLLPPLQLFPLLLLLLLPALDE